MDDYLGTFPAQPALLGAVQLTQKRPAIARHHRPKTPQRTRVEVVNAEIDESAVAEALAYRAEL